MARNSLRRKSRFRLRNSLLHPTHRCQRLLSQLVTRLLLIHERERAWQHKSMCPPYDHPQGTENAHCSTCTTGGTTLIYDLMSRVRGLILLTKNTIQHGCSD